MAYTKKLEIKIDGTRLLWEVDANSGDIKIKDVSGFELSSGQLSNIQELLNHLVNLCNQCPDVKSLEYSDIYH